MCIICDAPESIEGKTELRISCLEIIDLPQLPNSILKLTLEECPSLVSLCKPENNLPNMMVNLSCYNCPLLEVIGTMPNTLKILELINCNIINLPSLPDSLERLVLRDMKMLEDFSDILPLQLKILICEYTNLIELPDIPKSLTVLIFSNNDLLSKFPNLSETSISQLECDNCVNLEILPALPNTMKILNCSGCTDLRSLPNPLPPKLEKLNIKNCIEISVLPELPNSLREILLDKDRLDEASKERHSIWLSRLVGDSDNESDGEAKNSLENIIKKHSKKQPLENGLVLNFPDASEFIIFNSYMAEETTMKQFLEEDKSNFCFLIIMDDGNYKGYGCSMDQINIKDNIIVECKGKYEGTIFKNRVLWEKWYCRIGFDTTNSGIILNKLNSVVEHVEKNTRIFLLTNPRTLPFVSTLKNVGLTTRYEPEKDEDIIINIFGDELDYVSGNHCGDGTFVEVFDDIFIADIEALKDF